MLTDLHTRVIANAYRLVGADAGADHLALRTAAERSRARVRIGAPVRVADDLPAIPAALLTEKGIDAALARLLVPRLRLEERVFTPPRADAGDAVAVRHREALEFWRHATGRSSGRCWIKLTSDDAFWQYLASNDRALPRVQPADVAAVRRELPSMLVGSAVATARVALAGDAFLQVEHAADFVQAGWCDELRKSSYEAIVEAVAGKFTAVRGTLRVTHRREVLPLVRQTIGPLWGLVRNLGIEAKFTAERRSLGTAVLHVIEIAAGDADLRDTALLAWAAAQPLFTGTPLMPRYNAAAKGLMPPPVTQVAPAATQPTPAPPLQETTGEVCATHGSAPFENGGCMWCRLEVALVETPRQSKAAKMWNAVFEKVGTPILTVFSILVVGLVMMVPILLFYAFVIWMAWQVVREVRAFVRSLDRRELMGYAAAIVCVIGLPAVAVVSQAPSKATAAAAAESEPATEMRRNPPRPPLATFEREADEQVPYPEGVEPDDAGIAEAAVETYNDGESEDVEYDDTEYDDTESGYGADEGYEEGEW